MDDLEAIVRALATAPPTTFTWGTVECQCCGADLGCTGEDGAHHETCPYRRAVEWTAVNPA